ncbi:fatty acyl-AMP ligase [Mycolicibacterium palauense]|uniref:fatty acyl-AMP ligase n=1 Tax=Mycolicibacterium palauense TaxID=2034511 RepID=UPI000BFEC295|nr:fatty acyl-AMP ligase [Mycolicibacterium palauense]
MSTLTRDLVASATRSGRQLITGTVEEPVRQSWAQIHRQALQMAGGLADRRVGPHTTVAVLACDAADVAPLTQAIWLRRAAVTMLQQPTPRTDLAVWLADTVRAIAMIDAHLVVVGQPFLAAADHLRSQGLPVCTVGSLRGGTPLDFGPDLHARESDVALLQLTSGSTGMPKAVEITHANFAANAAAMCDALDIDVDTDVTVTWLPLSHDMGMIAFLTVPMQLGVQCVAVTPELFLRRPLSWAQLISRHRATITSGPNFAYSVLTRMLAGADPAGLDLSSLRVAVNGAEPIDHRDMAEFARVGARFGLRPSAPTPGYGLAEATLAVSFGAPHEPPVLDRVSRRAVGERHRAEPAEATETQTVVCVGKPVQGMEVRITRAGAPVPARDIGAIELRGPAVARRYRTTTGAVPITDAQGWLDSGDLGYLDERGRLYVCGRSKDLIVVAGRNLYPHDIERATEQVDGVRRGCVAAVRVGGDHEGFAVLAEVREPDHAETCGRIRRDVINRVVGHVGHAPRHVRLVRPGTLPKTASGKLRRANARQLLFDTDTDADTEAMGA